MIRDRKLSEKQVNSYKTFRKSGPKLGSNLGGQEVGSKKTQWDKK
jgi:hypothetical protein